MIEEERSAGDRMREERSHRYRESRVIEVWCEEPSHVPVLLGSLTSGPVVHQEVWTIGGPHVELQWLSLDIGDSKILDLLGRVAERHRVRCPKCGFDVVAGDRLGLRHGLRHLWENQPGVSGRKAIAAAAQTDRALSTLADAGFTRLTLATLGRILSW